MNQTLRAALIGCGRISFKHVEAFQELRDRYRLEAVCDPVLSRAEHKSASYAAGAPGITPRVFTDHRELLETVRPDVVTIATESGFHAAITLDALKAGAHVIVEKPMALSTSDAERMIRTARKKNKKLAVCFQNRFNPPVQKTWHALRDGRFGRMLHGMIQVRWNRGESYYREAAWRGTWALDGGTLMNQCTHGIDLLQWLMGEDAVRVTGVTRRYLRPIESEDFGSAIVEFRSGAVGIIEGSADVYPKNLNETLSLFGERGSVVIGGLAVNRIETWRFSDSAERGESEESVLDPTVQDPPTVYGYGHTALFADFADAVAQDRKPFVSGEDGRRSLDLILSIYRSMKAGKPVRLPLRYSTLKMRGLFPAAQASKEPL